uniref:cyclic nucleotide-gated channel beta-1-like isoform X2 n=1 Tax=Semicossyphus pulcher TaxID=241346 RepID=UPI0037E7E144
MRPSSRQRVAAWLLALPLGRGGEECARRGRLEMISFWLLCWKLLRATAGLRRTTPELTDSNHDNGSPATDSPTSEQLTDPVAMEISSSLPLTDLESFCSKEEELHYPEAHGGQQPIRDEQEEEAGNKKRDGDECDYLVFDLEEQKGGEEGGESEGGKDADRGEEGEEAGGDTEGEEKDRGDEGRGEAEGEDGIKGENESEDLGVREREGENEGGEKIDGETEEKEGGEGDTKEEDGLIGDTAGEMKVEELLFLSDGPECPPSSEPDGARQQEAWGHYPGNRDDLSDGHLSDCLQAELAVVYSDSDAGDDQWVVSAPCDITNQVEAGDGESRVEGRGGDKEERGQEEDTGTEEQREEEQEKRRRGRDEEEEQMRTRRDLFLRSPSCSSTASSIDPDRRSSLNFETLSENVSTEHVDFLLARRQWRKMEEEVKGQPTPKPGLRAPGSFQGTHSSLYPPTRSPRLKHREIHPPVPREPPLSSTLSPSSEDSGLDDLSYRSPLEEPETAVEKEIRLTLDREERHRRERGMIAQGITITRPSTLQTGRSPPRPPACRTPTLSISPSPSCSSSLPRSIYHEMTANNVIILEPDCSSSTSRTRLLSSAIGGLSDWPTSQDTVPSANVIVVETSNLIIRSASEFCLSSAPVSMETQESTFTSNPFFKLRSLSSQSLVEQEIRMVRQREEEWRRQREDMWRRRREEEWKKGRERYDTVLVSPGLNDNISYSVPEVPDRSVSSPSSPSRTRKMERSSLSCDQKFPPSLSSVPRRQNTMAQRWEASLLANQKKE